MMGAPGIERALGREGEAAWDRLRRQIELATGFWLGIVLVAAPEQAVVLRGRTERAVHEKGRELVVIRVETLGALRDDTLSRVLLDDGVHEAGCTWVEAVRVDPQGATLTPWQDAWSWLFQRANQKRDAIRDRLEGGLVLVLPAAMKTMLRETAPDLWSVRDIVLEIPPVVAPPEEISRVARSAHRGMDSSVTSSFKALMDLVFANEQAERAGELGSRPAAGNALLIASAASLAEGKAAEAAEAAVKAARALHGIDLLGETEALMAQARAALKMGDHEAAATLALEAIDKRRNASREPLELPVEWWDIAGRALLAAGRASDAVNIYAEAEALSRQRRNVGNSAERMLELCVALDGKGDAFLHLGRIDDATRSYLELALLGSDVAEQWGDSAWSLRLAAYSRMKVAGVFRLRGETADALACFEEAASIWGEAMEDSTSLEPLRERSTALNRIGELKLEADDTAGAVAAFEEAVHLRRGLATHWDPSPRSTRGLASSLRKLAAAKARAGDARSAKALEAEAEMLEGDDDPLEPRTFA